MFTVTVKLKKMLISLKMVHQQKNLDTGSWTEIIKKYLKISFVIKLINMKKYPFNKVNSTKLFSFNVISLY